MEFNHPTQECPKFKFYLWILEMPFSKNYHDTEAKTENSNKFCAAMWFPIVNVGATLETI